MTSPSSLTAHLSQATLTLGSIPWLTQVLRDEVEDFLLERTRELGKSIDTRDGVWLVDKLSGQVVGRWENTAITVRCWVGERYRICCEVMTLKRGEDGQRALYDEEGGDLMSWLGGLIREKE